MSDIDIFLRILDQIPVGEAVTVDAIRTDLEAAQIRPSAYGALFRAACLRGELTTSGVATVCRKASRRGGRALVYVRAVGSPT